MSSIFTPEELREIAFTINERNFLSQILQYRNTTVKEIFESLLVDAKELSSLRDFARNIALYMLGEPVELPALHKQVADKLIRNHQDTLDSIKRRHDNEVAELRRHATRLGYKLVKIKQ
jgi:transposase